MKKIIASLLMLQLVSQVTIGAQTVSIPVATGERLTGLTFTDATNRSTYISIELSYLSIL